MTRFAACCGVSRPASLAPASLAPATWLPAWLPEQVRLYLGHIEEGRSLRDLARDRGLHASTVMRQVRRCENRRDDPLMDAALSRLAGGRPEAARHQPSAQPETSAPVREESQMTAPIRKSDSAACGAAPGAVTGAVPGAGPLAGPAQVGLPDAARLAAEARRVLRRLAEPGAMLAFASDMDKAVVLRELPGGKAARTAVLDRDIAEAFCLKDWISCSKAGRISTYEITQPGRAALRRLMDEATGFSEPGQSFAGQHRQWGTREIEGDEGGKRLRCNLAESPVAVLGRRREKNGSYFLSPDLVAAAERLREDFELAQMGPRVAQNWERFLTGSDRGGFRSDSGLAEGPGRARDRVAAALADLGPGLGDIALRVCCFLEGVESAERRMGWAARSGKIVLRIALIRLRRHYDQTCGRSGPLIG